MLEQNARVFFVHTYLSRQRSDKNSRWSNSESMDRYCVANGDGTTLRIVEDGVEEVRHSDAIALCAVRIHIEPDPLSDHVTEQVTVPNIADGYVHGH